MTRMKRKRIIRSKQRYLDKVFVLSFAKNVFIVFIILLIALVWTSGKNENEDGSYVAVDESNVTNANVEDNHNTVIPPANVLPNGAISLESVSTEKKELSVAGREYSRNLSENDKYLLAKIAMAEAEGESFETKILVIFTILNRVESNEPYFPDTIKDVIFQKQNGVYQFTPIGNGRWSRVEPNQECWDAVDFVNTTSYDVSNGALYFEACSGESWHSRNLELICQSDNTRFYK